MPGNADKECDTGAKNPKGDGVKDPKGDGVKNPKGDGVKDPKVTDAEARTAQRVKEETRSRSYRNFSEFLHSAVADMTITYVQIGPTNSMTQFSSTISFRPKDRYQRFEATGAPSVGKKNAKNSAARACVDLLVFDLNGISITDYKLVMLVEKHILE